MPLSKEQGAKVWLSRWPSWVERAQAKHASRYGYPNPTQDAAGKIEVVCPEHGVFRQTPRKHMHGQGCPKCSNTGKAKDEHLAEIRALHPQYDFSRAIYVDSKTKMTVTCPEHGAFCSTPNALKVGQGCPKCGKVRTAASRRMTVEQAQALAQAAHGDRYQYDWSTFKKSTEPMRMVCKEHGEFWQKMDFHRTGVGCATCGYEQAKKVNRTPWTEWLAQARAVHGDKYQYDETTYSHSKADLRIVCSEHGEFFQRPNNHTNGQGCPKCGATGLSAGETELAEFIAKFAEIQQSNRNVLCRQELDITVPDRKLAFEYDGLYWHSADLKGKNFHLGKTEDAAACGWRVIHVFEDEWLTKRSIVESRIKAILGVHETRIGARDTQVVRLAWGQARDFLDQHHIQGACRPARWCYGLQHQGDVVAVMVFGPARYTTDADQELLRYASLGMVVGGFTKLLAAHKKTQKAGTKILSYADRRWSEGSVYERNGFTFIGNTEPGYWWCRGTDRFHRHRFQKHRLHRLLKNYDPAKTEVENCKANGYWQVFDCGHSRWLVTV